MESEPGCSDDTLNEEILALEAIYIDELEVLRDDSGKACDIHLMLLPATANETDRQFVRIALSIKPPPTYPNDLPLISIDNSRGLSDPQLSALLAALCAHAESCRGTPMLYELIEAAKDALTAENLPHCPCPICLDHFAEHDDIWKTSCYHYYHRECLLNYVRYWQKSNQGVDGAAHAIHKEAAILCPICREGMRELPQELPKRPAKSIAASQYIPSDDVVALRGV